MKRKFAIRNLFKLRWLLLFYDLIGFIGISFLLFIFPSRVDNLEMGQIWIHIGIMTGSVIIFRYLFRVYHQIWRYGGVLSYIRVMVADAMALFLYFLITKLVPGIDSVAFRVGLAIIAVNCLGGLFFRMLYRYLYKRLNRHSKFGRFVVKFINIFGRSDWSIDSIDPTNRIKIAIVGAGKVGTGLAEELLNNNRLSYQPKVFVDIDKEKLGREIFGIPVFPDSDEVTEILMEYDVQEVVLALPTNPPNLERLLRLLYKYR